MNKVLKILVFSLLPLTLIGCKEETSNVSKTYYETKCDYFKEDITNAFGADVAFLGDSITDRCDLDKHFPDTKNVNRGISADTTTGLLQRMDISAYLIEPKVVCMMIGTNNVFTMFDDYELLLQGLRDNLPNTKVVLPSITPVRREDKIDAVIEANTRIEEYAIEYGFSYIDIYSPMTVEGDMRQINEDLFSDGLHPNDAGYQVMASYVKPVLTDLLTNL